MKRGKARAGWMALLGLLLAAVAVRATCAEAPCKQDAAAPLTPEEQAARDLIGIMVGGRTFLGVKTQE